MSRLLACVFAKPSDGPDRWILFFDNGTRVIVSDEVGKTIAEACETMPSNESSYELDGVTP